MTRYRKKPVVIDAFCFGRDPQPDWFRDKVTSDDIHFHSNGGFDRVDYCTIRTLEGVMSGDRGDWIIRGVKGEIYPCKPDIFEATYEPEHPDASKR